MPRRMSTLAAPKYRSCANRCRAMYGRSAAAATATAGVRWVRRLPKSDRNRPASSLSSPTGSITATKGTDDAQSGKRPISAGYTTLPPWMVTDDTRAFLDFVTKVFDGEEIARVMTEDGSIGHGDIRVGDTVVLAFDRHQDWPTMPSLLRVFVPNADETFTKAAAAGAQVVVVTSPADSGEDASRTPSAISGGSEPCRRCP